jgi:transcription elongation factor Elf1
VTSKRVECPKCGARTFAFVGHDVDKIETVGSRLECPGCSTPLRVSAVDHEITLYCQPSDCVCHPEERTGGGHARTCPEYEPECTCYEVFGTAHQPGCPMRVRYPAAAVAP